MLINSDVGEVGLEIDKLIMPKISMANIACGGHIGNKKSTLQTVELAKKYGVLIGAHISYDDKVNFGRITQNITLENLEKTLQKQLNYFDKIDYIKPHGALYHDNLQNTKIFNLMLNFCKNYQCFLVVQKDILNAEKVQLAKDKNVKLFFEVFADRKYNGKNLVARSEKGAVLQNVAEIIKQYKTLKNADTICFHSDNTQSVEVLKQL
jgi:UPF0271 protein